MLFRFGAASKPFARWPRRGPSGGGPGSTTTLGGMFYGGCFLVKETITIDRQSRCRPRGSIATLAKRSTSAWKWATFTLHSGALAWEWRTCTFKTRYTSQAFSLWHLRIVECIMLSVGTLTDVSSVFASRLCKVLPCIKHFACCINFCVGGAHACFCKSFYVSHAFAVAS